MLAVLSVFLVAFFQLSAGQDVPAPADAEAAPAAGAEAAPAAAAEGDAGAAAGAAGGNGTAVSEEEVELGVIKSALEEGCVKRMDIPCFEASVCEKNMPGTQCVAGACSCPQDECRIATQCVSTFELANTIQMSKRRGVVQLAMPVDVEFHVSPDGVLSLNSRPCYPLQSRPLLLKFMKRETKERYMVQLQKVSSCEKVGIAIDEHGRVLFTPADAGFASMVTKYNSVAPDGKIVNEGDKLYELCHLEPTRCTNTRDVIKRVLAYKDNLGSVQEVSYGKQGREARMCKSKDAGVRDKYGDKCSWYDKVVLKAAGVNLCGKYDTSTFNAQQMCCACQYTPGAR
eukprot:TRINITY_DN62871_c0_g1_i1.p1 TRINITY_DN62871_c0_g1~~TRINITY_DN62871_c0_g1_i1.p1  ORF type:complete len:342 (-),score=67.28 TRINITY_DN62871_c0_g1_i1:52-1077(-)